MSIKAINWAIESKMPDAESKLILILISNYASEWGLAWPGYPYLIDKSGTPKTTLWRRMTWLQDNRMLVKMSRRDGQKTKSNAYLLPNHPLATEEQFRETYGSLNLDYLDYRDAWFSLAGQDIGDVPPRDIPAPGGSAMGVSHGNVPPRDLYTLTKEHTFIQDERVGRPRDAFDREGTIPVNDDSDDYGEVLMWIQGKKKLKHMPPQEWLALFDELRLNDIALADFREFYEWSEADTAVWRTGPMTSNVLRKQVEPWLRRNDVKAGSNGGANGNGNAKRGSVGVERYS